MRQIATWKRLAFVIAVLALLAGCGRATADPDPAPGQKTETPPAASEADTAGKNRPDPAGEGRYSIVAAESTASYTVQERFLDRNLDNTAVGKTSSIAGDIVLKDGQIMPSTITVDLRTLKSDSDRRDARVQRQALETEQYPYATFTITGTQGNTARLAGGGQADFKLAGNMKIHGAEKPVVFDVHAELRDDGTLHLAGVTHFAMTDFGIEPPNILNLISVQDHVVVNVDLTAKAQ